MPIENPGLIYDRIEPPAGRPGTEIVSLDIGGEGVNVSAFGAVPDGVTDNTAAFEAAYAAALTTGTKKLIIPSGTWIGHLRIKDPGFTVEGSGPGTILRLISDSLPTVWIEDDGGPTVSEVTIYGVQIRHSGMGGGLLVSARECVFDNVRVHQCAGFGVKFKNRADGAALNKFVSCIFFRNTGEGSIVIPQNDEGDVGYSNGNQFINCTFDRFFSVPVPTPTITCGTSMLIVGGWLQARDYAGIRVRGSAAMVRAVGLRVDSSSGADVFVEFVDGATINNVQLTACDLDGMYDDGNEVRTGNTLADNLFGRIDGDGRVVKQFIASNHDLFAPGSPVEIPGPSSARWKIEGTSDGIRVSDVVTDNEARLLASRLVMSGVTDPGSTAMLRYADAGPRVEVRNGDDNALADMAAAMLQSTGTGVLVPAAGGYFWGGTGSSGLRIRSGTADPESSVSAPPGSLYLRNNSGAGEAYLKLSGTGSTGWARLATV